MWAKTSKYSSLPFFSSFAVKSEPSFFTPPLQRGLCSEKSQWGKVLLTEKNPVPGILLAGGLGVGFFWTTVACGEPREKEAEAEAESLTSLNPNDFVKFPLQETKDVTHDSKIFRFALPSPNHTLGLPVASCIVTRGPQGDDGKPTIRPYTPISTEEQRGYFDLLIKVYEKGNMSRHIHSLHPGDYLEVKGPIAKIPYTANMKKTIDMVAGGTGITPMYQVLQKILNNPDDHTRVRLIFCNKTVDDILLKPELDALASKHKNFSVFYKIGVVPDGEWDGGVGHLTQEDLQQNLAGASNDTLVMVCGPTGFYDLVSGPKAPNYEQGEVGGLLKVLGYKENQVFKF